MPFSLLIRRLGVILALSVATGFVSGCQGSTQQLETPEGDQAITNNPAPGADGAAPSDSSAPSDTPATNNP